MRFTNISVRYIKCWACSNNTTFGVHYKFNDENDIILPYCSSCNRNDCDSFYAMGIIFMMKKNPTTCYQNLEVKLATKYKLGRHNSWGIAQHQAESQILSQYLYINLLCNNSSPNHFSTRVFTQYRRIVSNIMCIILLWKASHNKIRSATTSAGLFNLLI